MKLRIAYWVEFIVSVPYDTVRLWWLIDELSLRSAIQISIGILDGYGRTPFQGRGVVSRVGRWAFRIDEG